MEYLIQDLPTYFLYALAVIGCASVLLQVLEKLAKLTSITQDDIWLDKWQRRVKLAAKALRVLAMRLPMDKKWK